jgi:hypothetical protein
MKFDRFTTILATLKATARAILIITWQYWQQAFIHSLHILATCKDDVLKRVLNYQNILLTRKRKQKILVQYQLLNVPPVWS